MRTDGGETVLAELPLIELSQNEVTEINFIQSLQFPSLLDQSLVQIHVGFAASDICNLRVASGDADPQRSMDMGFPNLNSSGQDLKFADSPKDLLQKIRESIRQLAELQRFETLEKSALGYYESATSYANSPELERELRDPVQRLHTSYELHRIEEEIEEERRFLSESPREEPDLAGELDSEMGEIVRMVEDGILVSWSRLLHLSSSDDSSLVCSTEQSAFSHPRRAEESISLGDEIRQIAERLVTIKERLGMDVEGAQHAASSHPSPPSSPSIDEGNEKEEEERGASLPSEVKPSSMADAARNAPLELEGKDLSVIEEESLEKEAPSESVARSAVQTPSKMVSSFPEVTNEMRLDLSQLNSSPAAGKKLPANAKNSGWMELEVHPRTQSSGRKSSVRQKESGLRKTESRLSYPNWLRLLPAGNGSSSCRLLQLPTMTDHITNQKGSDAEEESQNRQKVLKIWLFRASHGHICSK